MCLLMGAIFQVSDAAHGPLTLFIDIIDDVYIYRFNAGVDLLIFPTCFDADHPRPPCGDRAALVPCHCALGVVCAGHQGAITACGRHCIWTFYNSKQNAFN